MSQLVKKYIGVVLIFGLSALACIFLAQLFLGKGSVFAWQNVKAQEQARLAELEKAKAEREKQEADVIRLRPATLDWDKAEEQAIKVLGEKVREKEPVSDTKDTKKPANP